MPTPSPVAEPGYTTTEFWGKVLVQLIGLAVIVGPSFGWHVNVNAADPATAATIQYVGGLLAIVVPELVYIISRSLRKAGSTSPAITLTTTTTPTPSGLGSTTTTTSSPVTPVPVSIPPPPVPAPIPTGVTA